MGHAEDDIAFDAGHMCSDIIEKQRCFFMIFIEIPVKIKIPVKIIGFKKSILSAIACQKQKCSNRYHNILHYP